MEFKFLAGAGCAELRYPDVFFPQENFSGIHDPVHARVLLLQGEYLIVVVSLELPSLRPFSLIDDMKKEVQKITGANLSSIWICMTHNLSAPHVPPENEELKHYIYLNIVKKAVKEAAQKAMEGLCPAEMRVGSGESYVNISRDIDTPAGWWHGLNPDWPADRTLTVLSFEKENGDAIAFLYHYPLKTSIMENAVMRDGKKRVTSDITGAASSYIEKKYEVPVLFFMGAGDMVPKKKANYFYVDMAGELREVNEGEKGFQYLKELGYQLGKDILNIIKDKMSKACIPDVELIQREIYYPGQKFYPGKYPYFPVKNYQYASAGDIKLQTEILRLDDVVIFGQKPESSALVGAELRKRSPYAHTLLVAMVNGGQGYLSDKSAYDRKTFDGLHSYFARGTAEQFIEDAVSLLKKWKGGGNDGSE